RWVRPPADVSRASSPTTAWPPGWTPRCSPSRGLRDRPADHARPPAPASAMTGRRIVLASLAGTAAFGPPAGLRTPVRGPAARGARVGTARFLGAALAHRRGGRPAGPVADRDYPRSAVQPVLLVPSGKPPPHG